MGSGAQCLDRFYAAGAQRWIEPGDQAGGGTGQRRGQQRDGTDHGRPVLGGSYRNHSRGSERGPSAAPSRTSPSCCGPANSPSIRPGRRRRGGRPGRRWRPAGPRRPHCRPGSSRWSGSRSSCPRWPRPIRCGFSSTGPPWPRPGGASSPAWWTACPRPHPPGPAGQFLACRIRPGRSRNGCGPGSAAGGPTPGCCARCRPRWCCWPTTSWPPRRWPPGSRHGQGAGEAIFAVARTAGWIAHALEAYAGDRPLRPRAVYTGGEGRD